MRDTLSSHYVFFSWNFISVCVIMVSISFYLNQKSHDLVSVRCKVTHYKAHNDPIRLTSMTYMYTWGVTLSPHFYFQFTTYALFFTSWNFISVCIIMVSILFYLNQKSHHLVSVRHKGTHYKAHNDPMRLTSMTYMHTHADQTVSSTYPFIG